MNQLDDLLRTADALIAGALCTSRSGWPARPDGERLSEIIIERAGYHGVLGLLCDDGAAIADWPEHIRSGIRSRAFALVAWELRHQAYLRELTDGLAARGVAAIILKGTALAYGLYPVPAHRMRSDTDLLVAKEDIAAARDVLAAQGFTRTTGSDGHFGEIHLQESWKRICPAGGEHYIDLHWQAMNAPALEGVLTLAECQDDPVLLDRLGPGARTMGYPALLLHACLHRATHLAAPYYFNGTAYYGGDRLIWLYDVKLLCAAMDSQKWQKFITMVQQKGAQTICRECLVRANEQLYAGVPESVIEALAAPARSGKTDRYLLEMRRLERGIANLRALNGVGAKAAHLAARAFPSAEFMRAKYPDSPWLPLPLLYARRVMGGITRKLWSR